MIQGWWDWLIDEFKKDEGLDLRGKGMRCLPRLRDRRSGPKMSFRHHGNGDQSAVHHCRRQRAEASGEKTDGGRSSKG